MHLREAAARSRARVTPAVPWLVLLVALGAAGCGKANPVAGADPAATVSVGALPPPVPVPAGGGNRALAVAVARSLIDAVEVSGRPIPLTAVPGSSPIRSAPGRLATPNLVDAHRVWRVGGRPREALAAVLHDHPSSLPINGEGSGDSQGPGGRAVYSWYVSFQAPPRPGLGSEQLVISMTGAPGGGTLVRADGEVVWVSERPAGERVPAGVSSIEVTRSPGQGLGSLRRTVTAPAPVAQIVSGVDGLAIVQPGTVVCPDEPVRAAVVQLVFRGASGQALAVASQSAGPQVGGCAPMRFSLGGHEQKPLAEGARAMAIVDHALQLRLLPD
jgi:hypothetical protein